MASFTEYMQQASKQEASQEMPYNNINILSVAEATSKIKQVLGSSFPSLMLRGEVSKVTYHSSGHIYFTLKDSKASINCVMFKNYAKSLSYKIETGQSIIVNGQVSVFEPRGEYNLIIFSSLRDGIGILQENLKLLRASLQEKGYFDNKKKLPSFPKHVVLITSKTSAALQDMLKIATQRYALAKLTIINTLMQGEDAKKSIATNLALADSLNPCLIIIARGGGSFEDLYTFNELEVLEAIYRLNAPSISAIGHEYDYLLSDEVASLRASTPTDAINKAFPDTLSLLQALASKEDILNSLISKVINKKQEELQSLYNLAFLNSPQNKAKNNSLLLEKLEEALKFEMARFLDRKKEEILNLSFLSSLLDIKLASSKNKIDLLMININSYLAKYISLKESILEKKKGLLNLALRDFLDSKLRDLEAKKEALHSLSLNKSSFKDSFCLAEVRLKNKIIDLKDLKSGDEVDLIGLNASKKAVIL